MGEIPPKKLVFELVIATFRADGLGIKSQIQVNEDSVQRGLKSVLEETMVFL